MFKKALFSITAVGIILINAIAPSITFAQADWFSFDAEFNWTQGFSENATTTTVDTKTNVNSTIKNFDFMGWTLVVRMIEFLIIYPQCFVTKAGQIKWMESICTPKGNENINTNWKWYNVSNLKVQDIIDWRYVPKTNLHIIIWLLFTLWLLAFVIFLKYSDWTEWSSSSSNNQNSTGWWFGWFGGWMWWQSSDQSSSSKQSIGWWVMAWRVWWWFIEKFFWKDIISKDWEENKDDWTIKWTALLFVWILFFFWNLFSLRMSNLLPIAFDKPITSTSTFIGIGILYWLTYSIFVSIIFLLFRWMLLSFIRADIEKSENTSIQSIAVRTLLISWIMIAVVSLAIGFLVDLASIIMQ